MSISPSVGFTLTTKLTKRHTIEVEVWPTRESMIDHLEWVYPDGDWREEPVDSEVCSGAFVAAGGFMSHLAPVPMGTIYLNREYLDINTLTHEVVHAAMHIYGCDCVGNYARARAHMTAANETIAYLIGDLMGDLAEKVTEAGLYDTDTRREAP